jgi:hypothetical protein
MTYSDTLSTPPGDSGPVVSQIQAGSSINGAPGIVSVVCLSTPFDQVRTVLQTPHIDHQCICHAHNASTCTAVALWRPPQHGHFTPLILLGCPIWTTCQVQSADHACLNHSAGQLRDWHRNIFVRRSGTTAGKPAHDPRPSLP